MWSELGSHLLCSGATEVCQSNACVDVCAGKECGLSAGMDCGTCSGATQVCQSNACVDVRAGKECGREDKGFLFGDSDPKGARVVINGSKVGLAPYQEELMAGEYTVVCRYGSDLYKPARQTLTLGREGKKVTMKFAPNFGTLRVESVPSGAKIELGGEPTGEVAPFTFPGKRAGACPVRLTLPLYKPTTATAQLGDGKETKLVLKPQPDFGILSVESDPPGAEISINGEAIGKVTPFTFPPRASGTFKVSVSKPLYPAETAPVKVGEGDLDRPRRDREGHPRALRTRRGGHEVEVRAKQYGAPKQRPAVKRGDETLAEFVMSARLGAVKVTAAIVDNGTSEPVTAEVRVDGKALEDTAPLSKELLVGTYRLEVPAEGAHPFEQTVEVREGETQTVTALLAKMLPAEVLRLREQARLAAEAEERAAAGGDRQLAPRQRPRRSGAWRCRGGPRGDFGQELGRPGGDTGRARRRGESRPGLRGRGKLGVGVALLSGALIAYAGD